jgi:hypothetical protein
MLCSVISAGKLTPCNLPYRLKSRAALVRFLQAYQGNSRHNFDRFCSSFFLQADTRRTLCGLRSSPLMVGQRTAISMAILFAVFSGLSAYRNVDPRILALPDHS